MLLTTTEHAPGEASGLRGMRPPFSTVPQIPPTHPRRCPQSGVVLLSPQAYRLCGRGGGVYGPGDRLLQLLPLTPKKCSAQTLECAPGSPGSGLSVLSACGGFLD